MESETKSNPGQYISEKAKESEKRGHKRKRAQDSFIKMKPNEQEDDWLSLAPRCINVADFAEARATEINTMMKAMNNISGGRRIFQKLPRHMRRRAMSHNVKRLPRRLRARAEAEVQKHKRANKQDSGAAKRSRRHRRRPKNLFAEYERRKRKHIWLETHIWHAKRFHMSEKWGYKIPHHPNEKSVRASYRALAKHCLIQDISYYGVIEVTGPQGYLLKSLAHLTNTDSGLTFASLSYLGGKRHGTTMLYQYDKYPYSAISVVNFLWKCLSCECDDRVAIKEETNTDAADKFSSTESRQLWMWVHPSSYETVLNEIVKMFHAKPVMEKMKKKRTQIDKGSDGVEDTGDESSLDFTKTDRQFKNSCVHIRTLKFDLLRFRLQGPLSHSVLLDVLQSAEVKCSDIEECEKMKWWESYYEDTQNAAVHDRQKEVWKNLKNIRTSSELSPGCVLSLTVKDPRLLLPQKKTKVMTAVENTTEPLANERIDLCRRFPDGISQSPIWEKKARKKASVEKFSIDELNKKRAEHLIPGTVLQLGREESRIPILLLHNPGKLEDVKEQMSCQEMQNSLGFGGGWDIVIPSGWGMAFWIALIYRGARAGGEREAQSASAQQGLPYFPYDFPDTLAYNETSNLRKNELESKYSRYPPDKRTNYAKFGVVAPFCSPWEQLVVEWNDTSVSISAKEQTSSIDVDASEMVLNELKVDDMAVTDSVPRDAVYVLRSRSRLRHLAKSCHRYKNMGKDCITSSLSSVLKGDSHALVCVSLRMVHRGVPALFGMVCLADSDDLQQLYRDKNYGGPLETLHKDPSLILKKLDKKCKKRKTKLDTEVKAALVAEINASNSLVSSVKNSCNRQIIGYVCKGSHTFSTGTGCALAYCTIPGLIKMLGDKPASCHAVVLVRNIKSLQYRFAYLSVLTKCW
ncbi:ribonucleases P/MRP protein subunit POP1-like isoform X2 [Saccoglossus kowalevskii]|uniref:Ribonucleases P/MRP protein subunit POP1-like n=1 Tax=Saccoglossus kowalevskii TaxID=10224 RepID=A0ABM0GUF7_SACKO|nr:PREDICTED: ribonucleases P/MRP protein subunit POP1-like [Saccoglossus kowalevskii]